MIVKQLRDDLTDAAKNAVVEWLKKTGRTAASFRTSQRCGFVRQRNPDADDGVWKINGRRVFVYVRKTVVDKLAAAAAFKAQEEAAEAERVAACETPKRLAPPKKNSAPPPPPPPPLRGGR